MLQRRRRDIQSFSNTGYIDDTINKEVTLANRSRISIRVTKKMARSPGVVDHVKILIIMQNLAALRHTVWA